MSGSVLYVVARYPKLTETFVVNEWLALRNRFPMRLAALHETRQPVVQPGAAALLPEVWFVPLGSVNTLVVNVRTLARHPRRCVRTLMTLVLGSARMGVREVVKSGATYVKAVALADMATQARIAHVHAHFANHPATTAWVIHELTGLPFSFTAHANDLFRRPVLLDRKLAEAAFVVAVSDYNAARIRDVASEVDVHVIHCGVDTDHFCTGNGSGSRQRVYCVASFEAKKGHRVLLHAVALLATRYHDLRVVLIGDGPERGRIEQLARDLDIGERVEFLGARTSGDVAEELQRAAVFVLASVEDRTGRMEGIPVALMEAMASGVPVVSTRLSGIPELLAGRAGLLVDPGDPVALAGAIARVFDDEGVRRALARRGRQRVVERFNLVSEAMRLGDLFEQSVGART